MERTKLSIKQTLKNSFRMLYESAVYLLLFEMIYKAFLLIISKPIFEIIVSLFNKDGEHQFLINKDITKLLLRTTGWLMIVVVAIVAVILIYYEFTIILMILDSKKKKEKIDLLEITKTALVKVNNAIKFKNIGLVIYMSILIPILNLGVQSSLYPILSIPHVIIKKITKYPLSIIMFILLVFALVYLFAKLSIVLPIMILNNKSFKDASKISFKTIKDRILKLGLLIIILILAWLVLTYPPLMILEIIQLKLPKVLRSLPNIFITIFTLFITPLVLAVSLVTYNSYNKFDSLKREEIEEKRELSYLGKKIWVILGKLLLIVENLILKLSNHIKTFIFISLALVIALVIYRDESITPIYNKQLLLGHRGGDYKVENTVDTILFAGTNGADYVEIDVLLTKDNIPVVIHDNSLKRLADTSKKISDLTFDEVKEIIIEDGDDKDYIPSLEEVAREVKGKLQLLLEFKTHDKEQESVVERSIEVLDKEGILEETVFQTAEDDILKEFNEKYEDLPMGYIFKGRIGLFPDKQLANKSVDFISVKQSLINKNMIRDLHRSGKAVFTWTTNADYKVERLLKLGVDGIITDQPIEMVKLRDKYKDYN